ncbi:MAG: hypothetical protein P8N76_18995 [Pirellulaceae bacterium]|nr:hypothetical protein [Pirellulaceae bacterium]
MNAIRYLQICGLQPILVVLAVFVFNSSLTAQLTSTGGIVLVEEGPTGGSVPANLATGAIPFASSDLGPELGIPFHVAGNLNDQIYGNSNSWIGGDNNPSDPLAFAGIDFGAVVNDVQSIAFGRDNLAAFTDRSQGLYSLQYTQVASPSGNLGLAVTGDPGSGWADLGTLDYGASEGHSSNYNQTFVRHRFNFDAIAASGLRLVVPATGIGGGTAIDEIEVYNVAGDVVDPPPPPSPFDIISAEGYQVSWDGNDGDYFDDLAPPSGSVVPDNAALAANGATAFSSSDLGPEIGIGFHVASNLNDGFYGNANSWISGSGDPDGPPAVAGIALGSLQPVTSIAFGRDNGNTETDACGGTCVDRWAGQYTLQVTTADDPSGAADEAWTTVASLNYLTDFPDGPGGSFTGHLRHEFDVAQGDDPVMATGVRLLVPVVGLAGGTAVDELEVYVVPEPSSACLALIGLIAVCSRLRRRN